MFLCKLFQLIWAVDYYKNHIGYLYKYAQTQFTRFLQGPRRIRKYILF